MIAENTESVRRRIRAACSRTGRNPEEVSLIAVSKTFGTALIAEARACGIGDFGENYVQELRDKQRILGSDSIRWHFIGHLQTNKIKYIAEWISFIHSVESTALAEALSKMGTKLGRTFDIMIEVNTSREVGKFGQKPGEALDFLEKIRTLPGIRPVGFMTMGPMADDPEQSRPSFRILRELRNEALARGAETHHLSMGMTNDFELAIEEGATMVRVGTAIFGRRTVPAA